MIAHVAPPSAVSNANRLERFVAAAKAAGVKLTHQRLEIFREVAESLEHPDAEMVFRAVRKRVPTVSLDTVYRTLWKLHELGLVSTLGPQRDSVRFDANTDPHHHYVCLTCGLVRDFESETFNQIRVPATVADFGDVVGTHVELRGHCTACQAKRQATNTRATKPTNPQ